MSQALLGLVLIAALGNAQDKQDKFQNEPAARATYDKMLGALLEAETLYYECAYRWESRGREIGTAKYKTWLKKPNHFRIEAVGQSGRGGTLVGDGENMWTFWLDRRPLWNNENYKRWEETSENVYARAPTPPEQHSISHAIGRLGAGMSMAVLNPSRFHGAPSSMDRYLDGVRSVGVEEVDGVECDVIEVSFMKNQRSQFFWVARKDSLPRRQKGVVRVNDREIITHETWTEIAIDLPIADERFAWMPPDGWREWRRPPSRSRALKQGMVAPAISGPLLGGGEVSLSDYRGKIVWLNFWRVG